MNREEMLEKIPIKKRLVPISQKGYVLPPSPPTGFFLFSLEPVVGFFVFCSGGCHNR